MSENLNAIDSSIGEAIRAARFSRGLTQNDLASYLGITRATVASYETGRRKITADTLIQISHLCGKPLRFFDPMSTSQDDEPAKGQSEPQASNTAEAPALTALMSALELRPDAIPIVMEFLEAWLSDQREQASLSSPGMQSE